MHIIKDNLRIWIKYIAIALTLISVVFFTGFNSPSILFADDDAEEESEEESDAEKAAEEAAKGC